MRQLMLLFGLTLFMFVAAVQTPATAQTQVTDDLCSPPGYPTDVRPQPRNAPTVVKLGMRVFDITEINDVNQTISIDIVLRMQWVDDRLADKGGCKLSVKDVWVPSIIMVNSGRMFKRWPETVSISTDGQVEYMQRVSGTFSGYQHLAHFPFDQQFIPLRFMPREWSVEKLVFEDDDRFTGIRYPLNISDWTIRGVDAEIEKFFFNAVNQERSSYTLTVTADRHASFYVWKILMPIALIVVMSWCVFWINPTEFGTQLGLSASSVLTMVAFIFATTGLLPILGYFTLMDAYIALATVFVFLGLLQSLITGYVASRGHVKTAVRIDLICRFLFPIGFIAMCASIFVISGILQQPDLTPLIN